MDYQVFNLGEGELPYYKKGFIPYHTYYFMSYIDPLDMVLNNQGDVAATNENDKLILNIEGKGFHEIQLDAAMKDSRFEILGFSNAAIIGTFYLNDKIQNYIYYIKDNLFINLSEKFGEELTGHLLINDKGTAVLRDDGVIIYHPEKGSFYFRNTDTCEDPGNRYYPVLVNNNDQALIHNSSFNETIEDWIDLLFLYDLDQGVVYELNLRSLLEDAYEKSDIYEDIFITGLNDDGGFTGIAKVRDLHGNRDYSEIFFIYHRNAPLEIIEMENLDFSHLNKNNQILFNEAYKMPYLWTQDQGMSSLPIFSNETAVQGLFITDKGDHVAGQLGTWDDPKYFVWDTNNDAQFLIDLVKNSYPELISSQTKESRMLMNAQGDILLSLDEGFEDKFSARVFLIKPKTTPINQSRTKNE